MLRVKLKVAATVPIVWGGKTVRHDWMPAGSEVDLPEEDFSPDVHQKLEPDPIPGKKRIAPVVGK
jgi:hypothetical protein